MSLNKLFIILTAMGATALVTLLLGGLYLGPKPDGEGLQVGDGSIDFVHFFRQLGREYEGTLVPEIWRGHQDNAAGFITALHRLAEAYAEAHGA